MPEPIDINTTYNFYRTVAAVAAIVLSLVAIVISLLAVVVASLAYQLSKRPALVFLRRSSEENTGKNIWRVQNIGKGPALNVIIADWINKNERREARKHYPITEKDIIALPWIKEGGILVARYTDVDGNIFSTFCQKDENELHKKLVWLPKVWPFYKKENFPKLYPVNREYQQTAKDQSISLGEHYEGFEQTIRGFSLIGAGILAVVSIGFMIMAKKDRKETKGF
jgi:hypothetical protein